MKPDAYRAEARGRGQPRVFYGWWIVAASCVVMGFAASISGYGATLFFTPVSRSLDTSRTALSFLLGLSRFENAIVAPVAGYFIDRFGPRWPMFVGIAIAGTGLICFGLFTNSLFLFFLTWTLMVASGIGAAGFAPAWAAINNWFVRRRGLAMGLGAASQGLGGALLVPLWATFIMLWGWRTAAVIAGILMLVIVLPVTSIIRTRPAQMGLRPDGDPPGGAGLGAGMLAEQRLSPPQSIVVDFTVGEAARTSTLWLLTAALTIRQFAQAGVILHLGPLLVDRGYGTVQVGGTVGLLALLATVGALAIGWASDRWPRRLIMALIVGTEALALGVLLVATATWQVYAFVLVYGFGQGAHVINRSMLGEYFGQRSYAKIWGLMSMVSAALGWGQVFAGWVYDSTQSYAIALGTFMGLHAIAAILYSQCRRPRAPQDRARAESVPEPTADE